MGGTWLQKYAACVLCYCYHKTIHKFGVGFVVVHHRVFRFTSMNERIVTISIKANFHLISRICVHTPTEEENDDTNEQFYECLEESYGKWPHHNVNIVLANAKVGKEGILGLIVGKFSPHDNTSDNGERLVDFYASRNTVICNARFLHLNINKATLLQRASVQRSAYVRQHTESWR